MRSFVIVLLVCLSFSLQAKKRFVVAAYVSGDSLVRTEQINAKKLTHLYYTFVSVEGGKVADHPNDALNLQRLTALKAEHPNLNVLFSLGGTKGSQGYTQALTTDSSRLLLAASVCAYLQEHTLDGVEIHWTMKPRGMFGNSFNRTDQHNLVLFLKTLRQALDDLGIQEGRKKKNRYLLCLAGSVQRQYLFHSELQVAQAYLDYINLQTYNYRVEILNQAGVSSTLVTSHHSSLYPSRTDSWMRLCVDRSVNEYLNQTIASKKLVVGIACYGLGWSNAYDEFNGVFQWAESRVKEDLSYKALTTHYLMDRENTRYWDKQAKARYLYNRKSGLFISYDDAKAVRKKTRYIHRRRLGGAIMNVYGQDNGDLLRPLRRGLRRITFPYLIF